MSAAAAALFSITERPAFLLAGFALPQRMVSWSLNRPGFAEAREVAFVEVRGKDLPAHVCPGTLLAERLQAEGVPEAVGLMTSRNVRCRHLETRCVDGVRVACLVTAGLNNGERVGARVALPWVDLPEDEEFSHRVGTVNILAAASVPMTDGALLEALSIVTQARTVAILEAGHVRPGAEGPVTGTGTDCIVVSAPSAGFVATGEAHPYAGLHTALGEALGGVVLAATRAAVSEWMAERARD